MNYTLRNFILLTLIPLLNGCGGGGGGGSSASAGAFFASNGGGGSIPGGGGGGAELATIHNPEPATMFLIGGGMMALTYMKRKHKR